MTITLQEFQEKCKEFNDLEKRGSFYPMFMKMMNNGFEIEAMLFILSTWNFATFRYAMKTFDILDFTETVRKCEPTFAKLKNYSIQNIDFESIRDDIKILYNSFQIIKGVKYTGTAKLLHLKNPNLFVMWDSYIKRKYDFSRGSADDYVDFLKKMQEMFGHIVWHNEERTLAKAIDEYNYLTITMPEMENKRK